MKPTHSREEQGTLTPTPMQMDPPWAVYHGTNVRNPPQFYNIYCP